MSDEQPATPEVVQSALDTFLEAVRKHYGARLGGLMLFGSRPRGDASFESDADLAVVLKDRDLDYRRERSVLTDLTYDPLIEHGLHIRAWPISEDDWLDPSKHRDPSFVMAVKRDARPLNELVTDYRKWRQIFPKGGGTSSTEGEQPP